MMSLGRKDVEGEMRPCSDFSNSLPLGVRHYRGISENLPPNESFTTAYPF
jgi:hypothetical protein